MTVPESDVDVTAALAWWEWRGNLWEQLVELPRGSRITLSARDTGVRLMSFRLMSSGSVRATVTAEVYRAMPLDLRRHFVDLGFATMRNWDLRREERQREVERLVAPVVAVLKYAFEIADPSQLVVDDEDEESPVPPPRTGWGADGPATVPHSREHLLALAAEVVADRFGQPAEVHDGHIHLESGSGLPSNLIAAQTGLGLECVAVLCPEIPDMALLGAVIAEHSVRWPDVAIVVTKGMVFAVRTMTASAFHARNLRTALSAWERFLCDGAVDIAEQLYPGTEATLACATHPLPRQLAALLELHYDRPGKVTPGYLVEVTRANAPLLRRYLRICGEFIAGIDAQQHGGGPADPDGVPVTALERQVCQSFLPVLTEAIKIAAQANAVR